MALQGGQLNSAFASAESQTPQFGYFTDSRYVNFYVPGSDDLTPQIPSAPVAPTKEDPVDSYVTKMPGFKVQSLWPQTPVYSKINIDVATVNQAFVKVAIQEMDGKLIWGWVMRKFLRKGLKRNDKRPQGKRFTGVSYGDYKFNSVSASPAEMRFVTGTYCDICFMSRSDHRVYETEEARAFVKNLISDSPSQQGRKKRLASWLELFLCTPSTSSLCRHWFW